MSGDVEELHPIRDPGHASLFIELDNGRLTITHGTKGVVLAKSFKTVPYGTWDSLFDYLMSIEGIKYVGDA